MLADSTGSQGILTGKMGMSNTEHTLVAIYGCSVSTAHGSGLIRMEVLFWTTTVTAFGILSASGCDIHLLSTNCVFGPEKVDPTRLLVLPPLFVYKTEPIPSLGVPAFRLSSAPTLYPNPNIVRCSKMEDDENDEIETTKVHVLFQRLVVAVVDLSATEDTISLPMFLCACKTNLRKSACLSPERPAESNSVLAAVLDSAARPLLA